MLTAVFSPMQALEGANAEARIEVSFPVHPLYIRQKSGHEALHKSSAPCLVEHVSALLLCGVSAVLPSMHTKEELIHFRCNQVSVLQVADARKRGDIGEAQRKGDARMNMAQIEADVMKAVNLRCNNIVIKPVHLRLHDRCGVCRAKSCLVDAKSCLAETACLPASLHLARWQALGVIRHGWACSVVTTHPISPECPAMYKMEALFCACRAQDRENSKALLAVATAEAQRMRQVTERWAPSSARHAAAAAMSICGKLTEAGTGCPCLLLHWANSII